MTTPELSEHLRTLEAERAAAALAGLDHPGPYQDDLQRELQVVRAAYVGAAVSDIAVLRGVLHGRPQG